MDNKNNSTCSICGKGYYVCISCKDQMKLYPYKFYTDTSEHYKIHQIIKGYSNNVLTKSEAKERLDKVDLSDIDSFKDNIKEVLYDILGASQSVKQTENIKSENEIKSDESVKNIADNADVEDKKTDDKFTVDNKKNNLNNKKKNYK